MVDNQKDNYFINLALKKSKDELKSECKYEKQLHNFKNDLRHLNKENVFKNFLDILVETHF